ncbi:angiotensin-converting enzyme-like [Diabrotica virgifera virgifera]|uniref:Angiotensin-converting enzyme n=1 Tax=Diabrotica virgifera virgifera TaxID=50390 RepID=A0ABM5LB40_DIAVI|nr:angiotensin-converting enzyme-like [Diabrotica virgifera virgifera]
MQLPDCIWKLTAILANSRDEKELKHVWVEWRKALSKCKADYIPYVTLSNQAAKLNNFTNNAELWLLDDEDDTFKDQVQALWEQVKPLYLELHAYVRFKLRQKYGDVVPEKGPIPAHLLGNMWAQAWVNIASFTLPYPDVVDYDITAEMLKQNFTAKKIFETAESFFKSINLTAMPDLFWQRSIIEKPKDREIICHASAWDFFDGKNFRIKMCTDVNYEDMNTAHHEMGHIEYFLQYRDQPIPYRTGANNAFHEAVGDLISLSFSSTKHLRKIGLITSKTDNNEQILNNLYKIGLKKIAFLPFGYLIDLWRWDIFAGKTTPENYNCKWWELREKYQGIEPPVDRSEEDFDPAAKYHVVADVSYLRYFISFVIQFQFHKAVCEKAGEYEPNNPKKPLHECDIYQNTDAGNALKKMLEMGASKPWPDAMEALTGQRTMDASGILEYFKPLTKWLKQENAKNGVQVGWEKSKRVCVRTRQELVSKDKVTMVAVIAIILYFVLAASGKDSNIEEEEAAAYNFIKVTNKKIQENLNKAMIADWNYASNITDYNLEITLNVTAEVAQQGKEIWKQVKQFDWKRFSSTDLRRQFKSYSLLGRAALPEAELKALNKHISDMESVYSKAKICDYNNKTNCDLALEPELTAILANSRDEKELKHVWVEWRKALSKCKADYIPYVTLSNQAAKLNNFTDNAEVWLLDYEDDTFKDQVQALWEQVKPLYLELHAYVRFKLRQKYGDVVPEKGPIPAHLLGNMWAQAWINIASFTLPYPDVVDYDITAEMLKQNFTAKKIFETAESFFKSINLTAMPDLFWQRSIIEKPKDREIICHASAWDFFDGKNFRIKMCTDVNYEDMNTAHHEMGHIEYFLQYRDQPTPYRTGANNAFHEAVGDLISLSFSSTKHLRKIGLITSKTDNNEQILNNLYKIGLKKIAFLPFGYLIDLWRWDIFAGKTTPENYNCKWWELREKYQGIEPPVDRSEEDFDPAAKYHVVADVSYLRYFISFVIQFQFHKAVCEKAGEYEPNNPKKPLHECDIYQNTDAGNALKKMLEMGASKPWPDAMEALTGQRTMDASGLLEYFKPLTTWLKQENAKNGVQVGWEKSKRVCVRTRQELVSKDKPKESTVTMVAVIVIILYFVLAASGKDPNIEEEEAAAYNFIRVTNKKIQENLNKAMIADWNYASNITDYNLEITLNVTAEVAQQGKEIWKQVKQFDWKRFSSTDLRRQFKSYSLLGRAALPEAELKALNKHISDMESVYSKAKICDYNNKTNCDLALEPELTAILANSRDEKELKHVWVEWRKALSKCKADYIPYVTLSNQAAKLNNFTDNAEVWLLDYEDDTFKDQVQALWEQVKPLYLELHAYVRFKLRQKYGDVVPEKGPIPAHLLGNMWAQAWINIASFTLPYPDVVDYDITAEMLKQNFTAKKIFETAESFFKSINLTAMPDLFWQRSIIEKPKDREIICHASAWDIFDGKDFRIKMCTDVNYEDMNTAHHEMGHIEYFLQYRDQPTPYRTGANNAFHEAVGDLISLSFSSTKHLRKIGLITSKTDNNEQILNNLYKMGLKKIAFLPFGYLIDLWRWDIFAGKTTPENYNCKWWELREKYQGIEPPVDRSEEDFDPAAKYHVVADVSYLRYFISFVIQFQFHKAVCEKAGEYEPNNPKKPLHECDIYQNTDAGNALKKMLQMGASKPWPDAMEALTGQRTMDASGLLEYFKPLTTWLKQENAKNGVKVGWEKSKRVCVRTRQELVSKDKPKESTE